MNKKNEFEAIYGQHEREKRQAPPPRVWDRIERSLDTQKKSKKRFLWPLTASAAAMVGVILFAYLLFSTYNYNAHEIYVDDTSEQSPFISSQEKENALVEVVADDKYPPLLNQNASEKASMALSERSVVDDLFDESLMQQTVTVRDKLTFAKASQAGVGDLMKPHSDVQSIEALFYSQILDQEMPVFTPEFSTHRRVKKAEFDLPWSFEELSKPTSRKRELSFAAVVSPVYSYRQVSGHTDRPAATLALPTDYDEGSIVNMGGGVSLNYRVSEKWSVETGVMLARSGQRVSTQVQHENLVGAFSSHGSPAKIEMASIPLKNSMGYVSKSRTNALKASAHRVEPVLYDNVYLFDIAPRSSDASVAFEQHMDYLEIPLSFRYSFVDDRFSLSAVAGLSTNWLVGNNVRVFFDDQSLSIGKTEGLRSMSWSSHAGIALVVPVLKDFNFKIEPRLNYFFSDVNPSYDTSYRPYTFGVYTGILYSIGY